MSSRSSSDDDVGAPLPNFNASNIQLQTIAPALGVHTPHAAPDYLDYDPKGRGIVVTMFANAGMSYLIGTAAGGVYGLRQGLASTPSTRFRVQLNSVLNHSGRYGSRAGNMLGVFSVLYSVYEGLADNVSHFGFAMVLLPSIDLTLSTTARTGRQVGPPQYLTRGREHVFARLWCHPVGFDLFWSLGSAGGRSGGRHWLWIRRRDLLGLCSLGHSLWQSRLSLFLNY